MGALNLSIGLAIGNGNIASGSAPPPTPAPSFTTQPSVSPSTGNTGSTFTATPGTVANGSIASREWKQGSTVVSTTTTATPSVAGSMTYQETATGTGGTTLSNVQTVTVTTPAPTGISYVGQAMAPAENATLPSVQVGDLIIGCGYRGSSATLPVALPAGWTNVLNAAANGNSDRIAYKIATSTNELSGTWTNAEGVVFHIYRNAKGLGASSGVTNVSTPFPYPSLALSVTNGTSWVVAFAEVRIATQEPEVPPSGMINRTNQLTSTSSEMAGHDTNGPVSAWPGGSGGSSGGNRWRINTVELLAT